MEVRFHHDFEKAFHDLPEELRLHVVRRLELFRSDPHHPLLNNHALKGGEYDGYRTINVTADLRAVYTELDPTTALFRIVGSHNHLYHHQ